jgi:hypothetical protein
MSRAYRIRVRESLKRILRASDHVSTQLEILQVLPAEQMAELLRAELARRGFETDGKDMVRKENGVTVAVAPETGTVTVKADAEKAVTIEGKKDGTGYDEHGLFGHKLKKGLREQLVEELKQKADQKEAELQVQVTAQLEAELGDLRRELDQAVNRVTAEALKRKAAQMGQIKEMTEDPESGSLTIVVEV